MMCVVGANQVWASDISPIGDRPRSCQVAGRDAWRNLKMGVTKGSSSRRHTGDR
jgi:hypothetical protein